MTSKNQDEIDVTKGVTRIRKSKKNRKHNSQKKKEIKGQTTIYKTYISIYTITNGKLEKKVIHTLKTYSQQMKDIL